MLYLAVIWIVSIFSASFAGLAAYIGYNNARDCWRDGKIGQAIGLGAFVVFAALTAFAFIAGAIQGQYWGV